MPCEEVNFLGSVGILPRIMFLRLLVIGLNWNRQCHLLVGGCRRRLIYLERGLDIDSLRG